MSGTGVGTGVWALTVLVLGVGGWLAGSAAITQTAESSAQLQAQLVAPPETALAQALSGTGASATGTNSAGASGTGESSPATVSPGVNSPSKPSSAVPRRVAGEGVSAAGTGSTTQTSGGSNAARISSAWLARVSSQTGIPTRALRGYAGAALGLAIEQPSCHLGWTTLAALGAIESGHGTHGGAALGEDGIARPSILGPQLSGGAFGAIRDTDGGVFDGDSVWDRAVGPLQFIPSTWKRWGADGNDDGVTDPQQIDDAALAAGRYLCHYGHLDTVAGWRAAIFGYNHSTVYVDDVATVANGYAGRVN